MRASINARIRSDKQTDLGLAAVYLQVIINSKRTTIPLGISWPVSKFDNKAGIFKQRFTGDQEAIDCNILVTKEKAKINDIIMYYRHSDLTLTIEKFKEEYTGYENRHNFLVWMKNEIARRVKNFIITELTAKNDRSLLKNLTEFQPEIRFADIDKNLLEQFEAFLRQKKLHLNTVQKYTKRFKAYLLMAHKSGINFNLKSVKNYTLLKPTSKLVYLSPRDLSKLYDFWKSTEISEAEKSVLDQFLFCTQTGLRFSDMKKLTWKNVYDDMLEFQQKKGQLKKIKIVSVPLTELAYECMHNRSGEIFNTISEQKTNEKLKIIAEKANIRKHMTTHVARHTFATEFLRRGGHIEVLQVLLGHDDIKSTMVYVHVDRERLIAEMRRME